MFIAHRREEDGVQQPLTEHLRQTAQLAEGFAQDFGAGQFARCAGLLHDVGKYSEAFQARIRGAAQKCDHSTAGAKEAAKLGVAGRLVAYCAAGHHTGLQNAGGKSDIGKEATLEARLIRSDLPTYDGIFTEFSGDELYLPKLPPIRPLGRFGFSLSFFVRMLYSCLVDADFLDTERFMKNGTVDRTASYDYADFLDKLTRKTAAFSADNPVNRKRAEILDCCQTAAQSEKGLFTLTVPTGGGKTLSSLAFALSHLRKHGMKRIIYVIPYTSIIEQNARVFADLLGEQNVLEHHASFDFSDGEDKLDNKRKLAAENWDMPLIVTTNVQFFESLFANKSSRCRKLHNIANSVIILDEAQMLPTEFLTPCVMALSELVHNYSSTVVLCSATQPALGGYFPKGIAPREICGDIGNYNEAFRRTRVVTRGALSDEALSLELAASKQSLCIVNTRKHALGLFERIKDEGSFHLSTLMCPAHRNEILKDVRARLKDGLPCRVVSTRLIEAGVDVDFPVVYRSVCGLDSIVQSAGRCNREGRLCDAQGNPILGEVHVFEPEQGHANQQPAAFRRPIRVAQDVMRRYEDILSPEAISAYFTLLYELEGNAGLDKHDIFERLEKGAAGLAFDFEDIAKDFTLIEDNTRAIIIHYDEEADNLISKLASTEHLSGLLRSLQRYTVSVYEPEFQAFLNAGKLEVPAPEVYVLKKTEELYRRHTGLTLIPSGGNGIYI